MSVRWPLAAILITVAPLSAAEPIQLRETFTAGGQFHVAIREEASGELRLPAEGDKPAPPPLKVRGRGAQEYDERILDAGTDRAIPPRERSASIAASSWNGPSTNNRRKPRSAPPSAGW